MFSLWTGTHAASFGEEELIRASRCHHLLTCPVKLLTGVWTVVQWPCNNTAGRQGLHSAATAMATFLRTDTSDQQHALELKVSELYQDLQEFDAQDREEMLMLLRDKHMRYLQVCLQQADYCSTATPWIAALC